MVVCGCKKTQGLYLFMYYQWRKRKTNSSVRKLFGSIKIVFLIPLLSNPNGIILSSLTRNCSKWSWHKKGYPNIMVETQKSLFNIWLNNLPFNTWFPQTGSILLLWPKQHDWTQCESLGQSWCIDLKGQ